jgi:predicted PhzF superfamily epimerase YddE/YHI9
MDEELRRVRVFIGPDGRGGSPLAVHLDAANWPAERRQALATEIGYSETVFVTDRTAGTLHIHTPTVELHLAGRPLVGTAWLLASLGTPVDVLRPPGGDVRTWQGDDGRSWIQADPALAPGFQPIQLPDPAAVDADPGAEPDELRQVWAWLDEPAGVVRMRVFPRAVGIIEDEATGAAALSLGAALRRPLVIRQAVASEIVVRPGPDGTVEVGGRVEALT